MSEQQKSKKIWKGFIGLFVVVLGVFVTSRIVPILLGPRITLETIPDQSEVSDPVIAISGRATDTRKLTLNGADIALSPTGTFKHTVLLHPGYNTITFDTVDALGHTRKKGYAFLLKELETGTFAVSQIPARN